MALDYSLRIASSASVRSLSEDTARAAARLGIMESNIGVVDSLLSEGVETHLGTRIRVGVARPSRWGDPVQDSFGFLPTVWVNFRIGKNTSMVDQEGEMTRLAVQIIDRVKGDAVFYMSESTEVWLLRIDEQVFLNEDDDIWTPERLTTLKIPYLRENRSFA